MIDSLYRHTDDKVLASITNSIYSFMRDNRQPLDRYIISTCKQHTSIQRSIRIFSSRDCPVGGRRRGNEYSYIYIYVYLRRYTYTYTYIYDCICIVIRMHTYTFVYNHICIRIYSYISTYAYVYIRIYLRMHTYIYTYM